MSIVSYGKTTIYPDFDSGAFKGKINISNEYLNAFWFNSKDEIWNSISSQIAVIVDAETKKRMKDKMNPEAYKKEFANVVKPEVEEQNG